MKLKLRGMLKNQAYSSQSFLCVFTLVMPEEKKNGLSISNCSVEHGVFLVMFSDVVGKSIYETTAVFIGF